MNPKTTTMLTNTIEIITPEKAETMLAHARNPRPLNQRHVEDFVRHMENGTFELTHQGIALCANGWLVDGQHRLAAIVKTGREVKMCVARGLSARAIVMTDRGNRRKNSVVLNCAPRISEVITLAAFVSTGLAKPMEHHLVAMKPVLEEDAQLLLEACPTSRRGLTTAPVRLGAVLNMAHHPDWVCAQYKALALLDFAQQCSAVKWFSARMISDRKITSFQTLVYAFRAFNHDNREVKSMTVKNPGCYLDEIGANLRTRAGLERNP